MQILKSRAVVAISFCMSTFAFSSALACSSCGCTLTTDWAAQGFGSVVPGFRMDFRFDYLDQTQLRSGTRSEERRVGKEARSGWPADHQKENEPNHQRDIGTTRSA